MIEKIERAIEEQWTKECLTDELFLHLVSLEQVVTLKEKHRLEVKKGLHPSLTLEYYRQVRNSIGMICIVPLLSN
jgi:hypothetical protein